MHQETEYGHPKIYDSMDLYITTTEALLGGTEPDRTREGETVDALAMKVNTRMVVNEESGATELHKVPRTYREAIAHPHSAIYCVAMDVEYNHHQRSTTWILVALPANAHVIDSTWRYDLKLTASLTIKKAKARICARGDEAREGHEFHFRYSSTAGLDVFRIFFATAAQRGWAVHEADYSTAYLNAKLDTVVYMRQPRGYVQYGPDGQELVCMLQRAIYGLPQSGRLWQQTHTQALLEIGFEQCIAEHALFKLERSESDVLYLLVNVDNLYTASSNDTIRRTVINQLQEKFELNDLGIVEYTLGVRVQQNLTTRTTTLDQAQYITTMVKRFFPEGINAARKRTLPGDKEILELKPLEADNPLVSKWKKPCQKLGGSLNWVACFTRPDVSMYLNLCMRCVGGAHEGVYQALLDILVFLHNTADRKITYGYNADAHLRRLVIEGSDGLRHDVFKEGDPITFVDTSGGTHPMMCAIVTLYGGIVAARISKLACTVLSVCEAEWFGATTGATILIASEDIMNFMKVNFQKPMLIFCDNKAACLLSDSNHTTKRMRHVATRLAYLQERVRDGDCALVHIRTESNLADLGTKPLPARQFHHLASYLWTT